VDVGVFAREVFDIAEREQTDEVFEKSRFSRITVREASPLKAFRFRFSVVVDQYCQRVLCAVLVGAFEMTLARALYWRSSSPSCLALEKA